jgi:hypothetical protein
MIMGRAAAASGQRDPFRVDEGRALAEVELALAEVELAWADGGYHGFCADGGLWSAISSAAAWGAAVRAKPYRKFADKSL